MQDADDDGRVDARVDDMVARGTAQCPLLRVEDGRMAAGAAEAVGPVPAIEMQRCVEGIEARQLGLLVLADALDGLEAEVIRHDGYDGLSVAEQQEECLLANREQIDATLWAAELGKSWEKLALVLAHEHVAVFEDEDDALVRRLS